jgi:cardiolipin synthase
MNSQKIKLITNSDLYWDKYWDKIDKAKNSIFIITYDLDNKMIANLTMRKLVEAQERGVQVVLIVEHLNFYMKHSMYKLLRSKGGVIIKPNKIQKALSHMKNLETKKFFNRCHQKVSLIDEDLFLGSINIAEEYSYIKYGSFNFIDLNIFVKKTICYSKILNFFKELIIENKEQIKRTSTSLTKILELIDRNAKNHINGENETISSERNFEEFLEEKPPVKSEIQDNIYDLLDSSKKSITIIQSYYNNLKRVEDALIKARKRGVEVKLITAAKRDQQAYRYQYNSDLFNNLIINGIQVYEFQDKFFHMKAYYIDKEHISLGSMNNDRTSFAINNEANYYVKRNFYNNKFFEEFDAMEDDLYKNCKLVEPFSYRNINLFRYSYSYWWYFFLWSMGKMVPNRPAKYN